jgi:hypothetical protein
MRLATFIGLFLLSLSIPTAGAAAFRYPNLQPLPARDVQIQLSASGQRLLRFSTTSQNVGTGVLELVAGQVTGNDKTQPVSQRVFMEDGTFQVFSAGLMTYHPEHQHFHFDGYANYFLDPVGDTAGKPGAQRRTGTKMTFCVMDTDLVDRKLPGAPPRAVYRTCGSQIQGMSVGWADTYGYQLAGQEIDTTNLPDGRYRLTIEIDPYHKLLESNDGDNISTLEIELVGNTVSVPGATTRPGRPR